MTNHDDLRDSWEDTWDYMWSDLYLLADTAVMAGEEEEQRRRLLPEKGEESKCHKTVSEDIQNRFLYTFPRNTRSSLVKRRYTHQNPNGAGASSSSSSLTDYETKLPQNPSFDEPRLCDAELRAKKGKSKIVCEDDDDKKSDEERLYEKNQKKYLRYLRQSSDNLDEASTSSSFWDLHCCETYSKLLDYNTDESQKTKMKDPPSPNYQSSSPSSCLTKDTSRKRRAVQVRKPTGEFKKAKVVLFPPAARETPKWIFEEMRTMEADAEEPRLIFQRELSASDVKSGQSRLLMPFQKLIRNDFLTPSECRAMEKDEDNDNDENIGVGTILVNQNHQKWGLRFKIWVMEKDTGHGTLNYVLNWGWNDVVKGDNLKAGDQISLWVFRCRGVLCFALETNY